MDHEEYVLQQLQRAIDTARGIVAGNIDVVEGSALLDRIRHEVDLAEDPVFDVFRGVASETDEFPIDEARKEYNPARLAELDQEKEKYVGLVKNTVVNAARQIIVRLRVEIERRKQSKKHT